MHYTLYGHFLCISMPECADKCQTGEIFSAYLLLFSVFLQKYAIRGELLNSSVLFSWFRF